MKHHIFPPRETRASPAFHLGQTSCVAQNGYETDWTRARLERQADFQLGGKYRDSDKWQRMKPIVMHGLLGRWDVKGRSKEMPESDQRIVKIKLRSYENGKQIG